MLQFIGPLNVAAATNPASYSLIGLGKDEDLRHAATTSITRSRPPTTRTNHTVTLIPNAHLNIHYHYVLQFNLPGVNGCAPPVTYTNVFGRSSVPFFDIHGVIEPNPPMTQKEIQHNARVVARTLAKLG